MSVPILITEDRALLDANPSAKLETYLDHWTSSGYIAALGSLNKQYVIKQVIYDLDKVDINKIREIAHKIDAGEFSCPTCQRLVQESEDNNGESESKRAEEPVVKPMVKPAVGEKEDEVLELDDVEIQEQARARAIQKIVSAMDDFLLYKAIM